MPNSTLDCRDPSAAPKPSRAREQARVLTVGVDVTSYPRATEAVVAAALSRHSSYICLAPVHTLMAAYASENHADVVNSADLVAPDGMPVVWALKLLGHRHATRVYGPELMKRVLLAARDLRLPVGFYGASSTANLRRLLACLGQQFTTLQISYAFSPPFRPLTPEEDDAVINGIVRSGIRILFVGLGGEKQDRWMFDHRERLPCVMLGVGAAFDFLCGAKPQAPNWMMGLGLEWVFRLLSEPRRLWRRYLTENPRFIVLLALQLLGLRRF